MWYILETWKAYEWEKWNSILKKRGEKTHSLEVSAGISEVFSDCVWPSLESCPSSGHHLNMWFYAADGAQVLHEAEHPTYGRA